MTKLRAAVRAPKCHLCGAIFYCRPWQHYAECRRRTVAPGCYSTTTEESGE